MQLKKNDTKNKTIIARLSIKDKNKLIRIASVNGYKLSAWIRKACLSYNPAGQQNDTDLIKELKLKRRKK